MARTSFNDRLMAHLETDPVLNVMGPEAWGTFVKLVMLMARLGGDLAPSLGFGPGFPLGSLRELSLAIRMPETQLETQIANLVARGCLVRESDGSLRPPDVLMPTKRQISARANGAKGGRPRKEVRQSEMLLPLAGGRPIVSNENPRETQEVAMDVSKLKQADQAPKLTVSDADFHRVGRAAFEAAGFDDTRDVANYGIVRQWLADGAIEATIVDAVARQAKRMRSGNRPPRHMGVFTGEVMAAAQQQAPVYPPREAEARRRWREAVREHDEKCRQLGNLTEHYPPMPDLQVYLAEARAA